MHQSAILYTSKGFFFSFFLRGGSLYTRKKRLKMIKLNFTEGEIIFQKSTKVNMAQWLRAETPNSG